MSDHVLYFRARPADTSPAQKHMQKVRRRQRYARELAAFGAAIDHYYSRPHVERGPRPEPYSVARCLYQLVSLVEAAR